MASTKQKQIEATARRKHARQGERGVLHVKKGATGAETAFNTFHALAVKRAEALINGDEDEAEDLQLSVVNISFELGVEILPLVTFITPPFDETTTKEEKESFLEYVRTDKSQITRTELTRMAIEHFANAYD